jgi:uncharacterized membrane protein
LTPGVSWTLLNTHPGWVAALIVVAAVALVSGIRSGRGLTTAKRVTLLAIRVLALVVMAAAVLRPAQEVDLLRARRSPLVFLVDTSRSMVLGLAGQGREVARWLGEVADDRDELERFYRVEMLGLGDPPGALDPAALAVGGGFNLPHTRLGLTLEALARSRPDCAGVVLLSDGRDTDRPGLPPVGLPFAVYPTVIEGARIRDLWIEAVETPPVGFIRTPVEVRVRLGLSGLRPGSATVTLLEGGVPLRSETVALAEDGAETVLTFTPTRTGHKAYRVEVTPWPDEVTAENNRAQFNLNVIRDKTRVLLVAGTPTWDVKFLRRRLRQDPGVDLITFLILRTPEDLSLIPQNELSLIPFPTQALFSEEMPSFDAVIFVNFDYGPYVPRHYLDNLVRFVREEGGGFGMLGGDRSFTLGRYARTPLEQILPVDFSGAAPGKAFLPGRYRPRLTESGLAHPLFQWRPDLEENRLLWNALPELEGMNWMLRPKPGAVVLAVNPEARNEYGPMPLVALGEYGAGRTLAVATDSLWHWALPNSGEGGDDTVYRDFWTRALRWLVHDPEMELVRLAQPAGPLRAGQTVRLQARVLDRFYSPAQGAQVTGMLAGEDGEGIPLAWAEVAPGEYATRPVDIDQEGLWRVEVEAGLDGAFLGRDAIEFPVEPESPEALRLGVDTAYLETLAEDSGGKVFRLGDRGLLDLLLERGRAQVEVVGRRVEEVWATASLLGLSVLLFAVDWALRRFWE